MEKLCVLIARDGGEKRRIREATQMVTIASASLWILVVSQSRRWILEG